MDSESLCTHKSIPCKSPLKSSHKSPLKSPRKSPIRLPREISTHNYWNSSHLFWKEFCLDLSLSSPLDFQGLWKLKGERFWATQWGFMATIHFCTFVCPQTLKKSQFRQGQEVDCSTDLQKCRVSADLCCGYAG